jgi:hypothetical protein
MRRFTLAIAFIAIVGLAACSNKDNGASGPTVLDSVGVSLVASGLDQPVLLLAPPGDTGRLFVLEQTGRIRLIKHDSLLDTPFLDLSTVVSQGHELGLLGMAFYPDYATSGRFIVGYTSEAGNPNGGSSVLARYTVSSDPDVANATVDRILLTFDQPEPNHKGGMIAFGPDGYLYAGFGDGGDEGDPHNHGQDRSELLGSFLRLDVSGPGDYTIPADNPYVTSDTIRKELWNYGFRNPWRWSFDRSTGDLYIGDVGQSVSEEVDVQPAGTGAGLNYGWKIVEGDHCFVAPGCDRSAFTAPVFTYPHTVGCAVIGGYVYRGSSIPELQGTYFFSDNCEGWVHSFKWSAGVVTDEKDWPSLGGHGMVTSFGEDASGELYFMTGDGNVYKIVAHRS